MHHRHASLTLRLLQSLLIIRITPPRVGQLAHEAGNFRLRATSCPRWLVQIITFGDIDSHLPKTTFCWLSAAQISTPAIRRSAFYVQD